MNVPAGNINHGVQPNETLVILKSIVRKMTDKPDLCHVLRTITNAINLIVNVDIPLIYLWDQEKGDFGNVVYGDIRAGWRICISRDNESGSGWRAIHQGTVQVIRDEQVHPITRGKGVKVTVAYPIKCEGKSIGVLYMDYLSNWSDMQYIEVLLEGNVGKIARIIKDLNFNPNTPEKLDELKDEFAARLAKERIIEQIDELMGADIYIISLYDENRTPRFWQIILAELGKEWGRRKPRRKNEKEDNGTGRKALKQADDGLGTLYLAKPEEIHPYAQRKGVKHSVVLALTYERRRLGVIYLHSLEERPEFSPGQKETIEIFGHLASVAIKNALWLEDHKTLQDIMQRLTSNIDLRETAKNIAAGVEKVIPDSLPKLYLCDPKGFKLELLASSNKRDEIDKVRPRPDTGLGAYVMSKKECWVCQADNPDEKPEINPDAKRLGSQTVGCWPLIFTDRILGLLYLHFKNKHIFTEEENLKITIFANQAALAIHNATIFKGLCETKDRLVNSAEELVKSIGDFGPSIRFGKGGSFEELAERFSNNRTDDVKAKELENLFRKLFWDYGRITIIPILEFGYGGAGVVIVKPEKIVGLSRNEVVVKFGIKDIVEEERLKFKEYVEGVLGGHMYTAMIDYTETLNLAAICFSFVGTISEEIQKFNDYYRERHYKAIEKAVQNLFETTCDKWYSDKKGLTLTSLDDLYTKPPFPSIKSLNEGFEVYFKGPEALTWIKFENDRVRFVELDEVMLNPLNWFKSLNDANRKSLFHRETYLCINHGDLRGPNIFVDSHGNCWLIDFAKVSETHLLNDFAKLESTIKFELLNLHQSIPLNDLLVFERFLLRPNSFSEMMGLRLPDFLSNRDDFNKSFTIIKKIREIAHKRNERDDMHEYYVSLFFNSLRLCRSRVFEKCLNGRKYALLSASLLADKFARGLRYQVKTSSEY